MFKLKSNVRVPLPVVGEQGSLVSRWEKRGEIHYKTREFLVLVDCLKDKAYIEEIIGGHLEEIKDESLLVALEKFARDNNLLVPLPPIWK